MAFRDDPLTQQNVQPFVVRAYHLNDIRAAIEGVAGAAYLPWGRGNRVDTTTPIQAQALLDLRNAIGPGATYNNQATVWGALGVTNGGPMLWAQSVPGSSVPNVVRATQIDDLRRWFDTAQTGSYQFPKVRPLIFGINPSWAAWQASPQYTDGAMMANIKAAGATCIRSGLDWKDIQPNGHGTAYVWDTYDARVNLAQANGLLWVADVGTAPNWATGNTSGQMPPLGQYTADFQAFVTAAAQRYAGKIRHYEFVNEPNGFGWVYPQGTTNIAKGQMYAPWLQLFFQAVKAVDSSAWVSTGGIDNVRTGNGLDFINGIYSVSGAKQYFDAVAAHPYDPNNGPMDTTGLQNLRTTMVNNGDTFKPIWITEYGWDVDANPQSITPSTQQQYLQSALNFLAAASENYVTIATFQIIADIYGPGGVNTVMGLLDQYLDATARQDPAYGTFSSFAKPTT